MSKHELDADPQSRAADVTSDPSDLDLPAEMFRSGTNVEETVLTMQRRKHGLKLVEAGFTDLDGLAVFEGDIVLGLADDLRATEKGVLTSGIKRFGITGQDYRWTDGIVPYVVIEPLRPLVEAAIRHWEEHTPIRFVERTNENDYVSFESHAGCYSSVGRQGGKQVISLGWGCFLGAAIHEIGHALGLWHEQSRADRDLHIQIIWNNINPSMKRNFDKHVQDGDDLGPYDYASIMHYPAVAFSVNGLPTILTVNGEPIGQRNGLSKGDIAGVRLMYPWLNWLVEAAGAPAT